MRIFVYWKIPTYENPVKKVFQKIPTRVHIRGFWHHRKLRSRKIQKKVFHKIPTRVHIQDFCLLKIQQHEKSQIWTFSKKKRIFTKVEIYYNSWTTH